MPEAPLLPPHPPRAADAPKALDGIRVLDFTHFIAGPLATMLLGDLGAEIVKIEKIAGGDDFRRFGPQRADMGPAFVWCNRNKQSVALDLTRPEGQQIARDLAATADVVIENFSAGVMDRFGLGYAALAAANPRLVYCAVSAYGRSGPYAGRLGFDPIAQAESGFMSLTGQADGDPLRAGPSIMDNSTAMMACNTVLAALMARERLGQGQYCEVSLFDTAVQMSGFHAMLYLMSGQVPERFGNSSKDSAPTDVFEAADGPFYITCANDRTFQRLVRSVLGRPDLAEHPDFAEGRTRAANKDKLAAIIRPLFAAQPRADLLAKMLEAGVPAGEVRALDEVYAAGEIRERGRATAIPFPDGGSVPNIAPPFQFRATPVADPVAAPLLGQHTAAVLTRLLGYDTSRIAALAEAGVIHIAEAGVIHIAEAGAIRLAETDR
ncbi:MAG: CoA transferase [Alphaproteobacteria bacterium]|nr:CoA transferase [Alphaproteobacteria bacterium]MCB9928715.1 CoA transferase [Alphaproteobacteria bacterium]